MAWSNPSLPRRNPTRMGFSEIVSPQSSLIRNNHRRYWKINSMEPGWGRLIFQRPALSLPGHSPTRFTTASWVSQMTTIRPSLSKPNLESKREHLSHWKCSNHPAVMTRIKWDQTRLVRTPSCRTKIRLWHHRSMLLFLLQALRSCAREWLVREEATGGPRMSPLRWPSASEQLSHHPTAEVDKLSIRRTRGYSSPCFSVSLCESYPLSKLTLIINTSETMENAYETETETEPKR